MSQVRCLALDTPARGCVISSGMECFLAVQSVHCQKDPYIWAWGHFALPNSHLHMGMQMHCTAKKLPIYGHGDTLRSQKAPKTAWSTLHCQTAPYVWAWGTLHSQQAHYIWAWGHVALPKGPVYVVMGTLCIPKKTPIWPHIPPCKCGDAYTPNTTQQHPRDANFAQGAFSHSAGTTPIVTLFIPGKPPRYRSVHDPFRTASGVQNSGPWDPWLPVVKNSRLFAQRGHSARCAPTVPREAVTTLYCP